MTDYDCIAISVFKVCKFADMFAEMALTVDFQLFSCRGEFLMFKDEDKYDCT
jgi:hypothetical protein